VNALAQRRRHPAAIALLLMLGLVAMGMIYSALAPQAATAATVSAEQVSQGKQLFQANCATCHGLNAEGHATGNGDEVAGPALAGVGSAAVDFQMGTGRMPMAIPGVQAQARKDVGFSPDQIAAVGAYIDSLAPGPGVPNAEAVDPTKGDAAHGGEIFRVNCAMCHNASGAGGALSRGKYAPSLFGTDPRYIYEAMDTGPQSMPVFNDSNISPTDKRDIIAYLKAVQDTPSPGGMKLGSLGPVSEGLFAWVFGLGILVAAAVWLGNKAA
jgi:ubiquinol-cytochrome c reductase cytochrome c subunit